MEEIFSMFQLEWIFIILIATNVIFLLLVWWAIRILSTVRLLLTRVYPSFLPTTSQPTSSEHQSARLVLPSEPELEELCTVLRWLATELGNLPSKKISNLLPQTRMLLANSLQNLFWQIYVKPTVSNMSSPFQEISSDHD